MFLENENKIGLAIIWNLQYKTNSFFNATCEHLEKAPDAAEIIKTSFGVGQGVWVFCHGEEIYI